MNSLDDPRIKFLLFLILGGMTLFYQGLKKFKRRRLIQDIPTSKIDSAAVGSLVEIEAKVVCLSEQVLKAPISNLPCLAFNLVLEKYVKTKKSHYWKKVKSFLSTPYICLNDGGDLYAAINLKNTEFIDIPQKRSKEFSNRNFGNDENIIKILKKSKLLDTSKSAGIFFSNTYRLTEQIVPVNQTLYVLGFAYPKKPRLNTRGLKKNKFQTYPVNLLDKTHLTFDRTKSSFRLFDTEKVIVSFVNQEKLLEKLTVKAYLMFYGGPIIMVLGVVYLIYHWNLGKF